VPAPATRVTVLAGRTRTAPLPASLTARLRSVEVTETDTEGSVFTLDLDAGRSGGESPLDVAGLQASPVSVSSRVMLTVTLGARSALLMDGIVTELRLEPGDTPGAASLTITGEDVSVLLDAEELTAEHPGLDAAGQAGAILAPYAAKGIAAVVVPLQVVDQPPLYECTPTQHASDLAHLTDLAESHGYVAYAVPGPVTSTTTSTFYWGPPVRTGPPQPALSVDLGPETTFSGLSFGTQGLAPTRVSGAVLDRDTGKVVQIDVARSSRPSLSAQPLWQAGASGVRRRLLRGARCDAVAARVRAQADMDRSIDGVSAEGTVDGARYGHVLRPRGLVGVRGAGWSHDGIWYVQKVQHTLHRGSYLQQVRLVREGLGSTVPVVPLGGTS
jgi:hypothetical protein